MNEENIKDLLLNYINTPFDFECNFSLALYYENIGQTASAISFYLRAAERTDSLLLQYECLLRASICFDKQGCRNFTVKGLLQHAISILPKRPEAYFLLSRFYERENKPESWKECYLISSIGHSVCEYHNNPKLRTEVEYPGDYGVLFEKAVSSWWCGLCHESRELFRYLKDNYELDEGHRIAVDNNLNMLEVKKQEAHPIYIHKESRNKKIDGTSQLALINKQMRNTSWIIDDFYENPDEIREFALSQEYIEGGLGRGFIGRRTEKQFLFNGLKEKFESIIGEKITKWEEHGMNGRFQITWAGEPLVYHCDSQRWGGMLYLTPDAPYQCGTTLFANKKTRARSYRDSGWNDAWVNKPGDPHLDGTPFEPVDVLGNVYNRLVIFDASCIHSASQYFGTVKENSRLWQMFFFDS